MPLAPTTFVGPMPGAMNGSLRFDPAMTPNHLSQASGSCQNEQRGSSERSGAGSLTPPGIRNHLPRRLPFPMMHFQARPINKLAILSGSSGPKVVSRSPSPCSSTSTRSRGVSLSLGRSLRSLSSLGSSDSPTPRRMFPQESCQADLDDISSKENAPVVFDASLNFVLGIDKQKVRQSFTPTAAHLEPNTASSQLSSRIAQFLQRTDHVMDEWRRLGHKDDDIKSLASLPPSGKRTSNVGRSRSATNIMIKGFQMYSKANSLARSPSKSSRISEDATISEEDRTLSECPDDELSEMTADFAEEHSTSTLAAERIDAETSERIRLERELQDVTESNKNLQQTTERLEMELLYARAADLNGIASDGEDGEDGGVYKQRYEHAIRELEFTKRKMAQQHEDDLEQLVGLKKQLEKKLADAYEEVEEQRQVVGQWKRRVQKLNGEMHDLRLLLEEQTARNNLLEKKQRKFDSETQNLMDDLRQEKVQRERLAREKEIAIAEKFTVEQNLSDARLEIELKEERLHTLTQELEELTFGGKTEEEVAQLKKTKHELEKKMKDQEEELDDLAGQVQLLEQAKLRLEMSIEQQRKEMRKEMQQRDEELEDVRGNAHKKVKALEAQLETEHEERTILLREKHELERRLVAVEEQDRTERAAEAETVQRLKRDLKKTRALLRDAQTMLERSKGDSAGKAVLRQLKNQLEDAECARAAAVKAKQALEQDLNETQAAFEEASRLRSEAEERANAACRERAELRSQLEENEEELAEVLKKYRAAVQQVSAEQSQLQEAQVQISNLEAEKSSLKDQLSELSQRLESVEQLGDPTANSLATRRLEFRAKELESKLELEQTTRARLETQIARLKESLDKLQTENALLRTKEQTAQDAARRLQRSLRESRDEASSAAAREQEAVRARRDLEKTLEAAEAETKVARDDLRLALQRIDDLQSAIQGELDLDCSEEATTDNSDSD
ncbi:unconventional myosin-XVIIIa isoform X5 [Orussus abietinus]|uniref:unconventional myosin-XVIIIa isoform X5 n=1 Tax=Orussus abietinus TaxID=222816 RepID=UPI000625EAC6|nr:unconventional myosin-XVIIIa isoform X5 [Orussus abietinus]